MGGGGGVLLRMCSAEDLVVMKAFVARPHDWVDGEAVVARHYRQLDWAYVYEELAPLAEPNGRVEVVGGTQKIQRQRAARKLPSTGSRSRAACLSAFKRRLVGGGVIQNEPLTPSVSWTPVVSTWETLA